jgi:23S rRNA (cytidine1920-2'-O)/16S rRNA (cytidine1409-2'-O)-methyltransferase
MRLDTYLVDKKICNSREKAKYLIQNGGVIVNGRSISKPSYAVCEFDAIDFKKEDAIPYVSKGGFKLEKAIASFSLDFKGKTILDIGASTGGFTDCALKHGAKFVWAVDVGTNQLDSDLKKDERINSLENTDFRILKPSDIGQRVDIVVVDLSFISLTSILSHIPNFLADAGYAVLLIKPQFEAGPENVGKGGIVKNPKVHQKVIQNVIINAKSIGLYLSGLTFAPIIDIKKNIEYVALFKRKPTADFDIIGIVNSSFFEKSNLRNNK